MHDKEPCFPTFEGKCVSYGGRSFPFLKNGVENLSVDEAIEKLAEHISADSESNEQELVDVSVVDGITSICANKVKDTSFTYSLNTTRNSPNFSYNFKDVSRGVPSDMNVVRAEVEVVSNTSDMSTLKGEIGGATFPLNSFPLRATFKMDVVGSCGLVQLRKESTISLTSGEYRTDFQIRDFGDSGSSEPQKMKDAIEILAETLKSLDSKFNSQIAELKEENRQLRNKLNNL